MKAAGAGAGGVTWRVKARSNDSPCARGARRTESRGATAASRPLLQHRRADRRVRSFSVRLSVSSSASAFDFFLSRLFSARSLSAFSEIQRAQRVARKLPALLVAEGLGMHHASTFPAANVASAAGLRDLQREIELISYPLSLPPLLSPRAAPKQQRAIREGLPRPCHGRLGGVR